MTSKKNSIQEVVDSHKSDENGKGRGIFMRLRGYLLAGILVTAPIGITAYLTFILLNFVNNIGIKIMPPNWYENLYGGSVFPGLGVIVSLVFFVMVGWLATNFFGRLFIRLYEYILDRLPVVRTIYSGIKQVVETVMASQSNAFREVVMLEYPRKGVWSIGFVTGTAQGEVQRMTSQESINVFVPTTPNPTSGFLLFVPKEELKFLNMSVEEGIKLVVSAGIIAPPDKG